MTLRTLNNHRLPEIETNSDSPRPGLRLKSVSALVQKWFRTAKTRRHLERMPAYLLRDIGLTEQQREIEIKKRFWQ